MQASALAALLAAAGAAAPPALPTEYTAVVELRMPYIGLEMPMRVLTSSSAQKIEYYDGLEVDLSDASGTLKYVFNNSRRACLRPPPDSGLASRSLAADPWAPSPFLPDLSSYKYSGEELIGGVMCRKYTLDVHHGSTGTMDDHISFYWDAVLEKPVRWHMHARLPTWDSYTDEYIIDYLSFQPGAPSRDSLRPPCQEPQVANVSVRIKHFLQAAHAASSPAAGRGAAPPLFDGFLRQYGKSYAAEERRRRQALFERNLRLVEDLNERHAGRTAFRGNQFLDMTREEVVGFRGGRAGRIPRAERRSPEHRRHVRTFEAPEGAALPKAMDWRTARPGVVGPVKDQAMCGSCWTYSTTEPIESILAIRTGELVVLPEQFVLDCTWTDTNLGCDGGDQDTGVLEIVRKFGGVIPTARAYGGYLAVDGFCKDTRLMEVGAKITGWVDIKANDEQALLHALVSQGPMSVSIQMPDDMIYYDSGVFESSSCEQDPSDIDHAVTLVGFGTDEHGIDFYTIRNSFSAYWGDKGYIKIVRGKLDCCVSCEAGYPEVNVVGAADLLV